jgi:hypothetical protein
LKIFYAVDFYAGLEPDMAPMKLSNRRPEKADVKALATILPGVRDRGTDRGLPDVAHLVADVVQSFSVTTPSLSRKDGKPSGSAFSALDEMSSIPSARRPARPAAIFCPLRMYISIRFRK